MRYMTPGRFRVAGTGSDISNIPDAELASILSRAADLVDAYCLVPSQPQRYTFRGGTVTNETFRWRMGQVRVFPTHSPMLELSQFRLYATNDVFLDVDPDQVFVEPDGGWAEIVALSVSPVGFWAASDLISLSNPVAKLSYTYGYLFDVVDEVLSTSDQRVYRAQNQFWEETPTPEVSVDGSVSSTGISVNRTEGTVTFDETQDGDSIITASYTHRLPSAIAQATALTTSALVAERTLTAKGLGNLAEIQVEEVRLRRDARRTGTMVVAEAVPDAARALLAPYRFFPLR